MTTVRFLRHRPTWAMRVAGIMLLAVLSGTVPSSPLSAQVPQRHWLHSSALPPGAIGSQRLLRRGPLSPYRQGYVQPVEVAAPPGVAISVVSGGGFTTPHSDTLLAGMTLGQVYRLKVSGVTNYESVDIYPTVEVIDRLYPPQGKALKFPIPVQLTQEELQLAAAGSFVTRVIYVEDPKQALPIEQPIVHGRREQQWFEVRCDQDPLLVADMLGRPVAILRIGSRLPGQPVGTPGCDPPIQLYDHMEVASQPKFESGGESIETY